MMVIVSLSQSHYEQAMSFYEKDQLDSARILIDASLLKHITPEGYFLSAMIHEAQGFYMRAIADYEAVIRINDRHTEAYFQKGLIFFENGMYGLAIDAFSNALMFVDTSPTSAIYFVNDVFKISGTKLSTVQSMKGELYLYRAKSYLGLNQYENSMKDFDEALKMKPSSNLFVNRAELHLQLGSSIKAMDDLKKAIAMDSTNYFAWYNLMVLDPHTKLPATIDEGKFPPMLGLKAYQEMDRGNYESAVQLLNQAIELHEDALLYMNRGKSLIKLRKFEAARRDFVRSMQLDKGLIENIYLIGNTLYYEEKLEDAIGYYEYYLSMDRALGTVWYNNAMAHLSLDKKERGCYSLEMSLYLGIEKAAEWIALHCNSDK